MTLTPKKTSATVASNRKREPVRKGSEMKVSDKNLLLLKRKYRGYLEGKKVDEFFKDFGIKFAAGYWAAGDFVDRFTPSGYFSNVEGFSSDILSQIERVKDAGIGGMEFHDNNFLDERYRADREKIEAVKKKLRKYNIKPTNMNINLFTDPKWKLGGICNADAKVRREALRVALQALEIAKALGCESVALWPGSDGWDYNFEVNYATILERFVKGCTAINRAAKSQGLRFGLEAKLHEPREGNMVISTTAKATLVAAEVNRRVGGHNMGVAIDYGHEQMYGNEPADALYTALFFKVPVVNFHLNTAKLHSNDEDRITGTGDIWRLVDFCYAAIDTGYDGWFGEDQFTYRTDPVRAMRLSKELFANAMKKALCIYAARDKLQEAQATGDSARTIDVVKRFIYT